MRLSALVEERAFRPAPQCGKFMGFSPGDDVRRFDEMGFSPYAFNKCCVRFTRYVTGPDFTACGKSALANYETCIKASTFSPCRCFLLLNVVTPFAKPGLVLG